MGAHHSKIAFVHGRIKRPSYRGAMHRASGSILSMLAAKFRTGATLSASR